MKSKSFLLLNILGSTFMGSRIFCCDIWKYNRWDDYGIHWNTRWHNRGWWEFYRNRL